MSRKQPDRPALESPLPGWNDPEGHQIPPDIPCVFDAHVHFFPDELFDAVWAWFDRYGWPIRYKMYSDDIIDFLLSRGIQHIVGLQYAHKHGISRSLNRYMADLCARTSALTGLATVFPGEKGAKRILKEGFRLGLQGVKLHVHVQCFDMESPAMIEVYEVCAEHDMPLLMHVGREPKSSAYPCDPYFLCEASKLLQVLKDFPTLRICVPHLGADEFDAYRDMLERFDNLWLDTTMMLGGYFPMQNIPSPSELRWDRILFGSDFPNIPYAWDRELKAIAGMNLEPIVRDALLYRNAMEFFSIGN